MGVLWGGIYVLTLHEYKYKQALNTNKNMHFEIMKKGKIAILFSALVMTLALAACGSDDDDPDWRNRDYNVSYSTLNHVYDQASDHVYGLSTSTTAIVFHRSDNTADVTLVPGSAMAGTSFAFTSLQFTLDEDSGRYTYKSTTTPNSRITNAVMTIDFNEQTFEAHYTVDGTVRVVQVNPEVFFLANKSVLTYSDASESSTSTALYQFAIDPTTMTARATVSELNNTKLALLFKTIIMRGVKVEATATGLELSSELPETVSEYYRADSSTGAATTIDAIDATTGYQKFPVYNFKATLALDQGMHSTSLTMGRDDEGTTWTMRATGTTYSD